MRGATVHGHSVRLQEDGVMFDMVDRRRLEGGTIIMDKDQVAIPLDRKVDLGKPMSSEEAAKRTTIYRVDNVAFRDDAEVIEWVQRVFDREQYTDSSRNEVTTMAADIFSKFKKSMEVKFTQEFGTNKQSTTDITGKTEKFLRLGPDAGPQKGRND